MVVLVDRDFGMKGTPAVLSYDTERVVLFSGGIRKSWLIG